MNIVQFDPTPMLDRPGDHLGVCNKMRMRAPSSLQKIVSAQIGLTR